LYGAARSRKLLGPDEIVVCRPRGHLPAEGERPRFHDALVSEAVDGDRVDEAGGRAERDGAPHAARVVVRRERLQPVEDTARIDREQGVEA
jgi:hypothetical protein